MPHFVTDDNRFVTIEPKGGSDLSDESIKDLAAYHAFEARQRVANMSNASPDNVYQFTITLPGATEDLFLQELTKHLRGLAARLVDGTVIVSQKPPVQTTINLPAEIYEIVRQDAAQSGISPEQRLENLIRLSQSFRFVESKRDRNAELDRLADESRLARQ